MPSFRRSFFREADSLTLVPEALAEHPFVDALEAARTAGYAAAEWDAYILAGIAIQNERSALTVAEACQSSGSCQSMGAFPEASSARFTAEKGLLPKKPLFADSGDGWTPLITRWREASMRPSFFCA